MINLTDLAPRLVQNDELLTLVKELNSKEEKFNILKDKIQKDCTHEHNIETWQNPRNPFKKGALISLECKECGLVRVKPEGMSWEVCEKCWSPMKGNGSGLRGEDRVHYYICTNPKCQHEMYHT